MKKILRRINAPLKLMRNRVNRSYQGGKLIEQWQGLGQPQDNNQPEEWLASLVKARNSIPIPDEGVSKVARGSRQFKLTDIINSDPDFYLGSEHYQKYRSSMGVLTKILDASVRLSIQVHPTKAFAKQFFSSDYGKTEAWYILGGRNIAGEEPYVLAGFKPGVTREVWKKYFEEQDIDAMISALHKFYVHPGDVVLIDGGLAHAIGSGSFLIEIQEPTDYTMRVERKTFDGKILPDPLCHQGLGFELMLDCFTYESHCEDETRSRCFKSPELIEDRNGNQLISLISEKDTTCFTMKRLIVKTAFTIDDHSFKTCIVVTGGGFLYHNKQPTMIKQGESLFLPAGLGEIKFVNVDNILLELILCYPPR